ncbi:biotin/lipoyl-containing protein [Martelella radicis]|uniref:Pyruvate dehydrogenase E2 component (Dihydrolipoamide acetyltransferase)/2-oxoglutarate dehydrogenase E2 component (Dihydrolipoamide succinyltransferase) n=1 Tax=Martelella radicis TaxID=1397476 RepID=A0A7W6PAU9_9HYPH|nr:biotin/lipoyl-containing protein [Martelella radicis]MBB4123235.1 pyruvate dehydrogenase E2 component (dihydrolipoamide acetyltransferase)/2-oxoglutarate dehydrogenase E2 component (dihydrolipoamide succinyltransferase) [Martelella radicis]
MPHEVIMPALGMAQDTGKIVRWLKKSGEPVSSGEAIMEVETDKAVMEVEAEAGGFLSAVSAGDGEDVPVGSVVAVIVENEADVREAVSGAPEALEANAEEHEGEADEEPLPEGAEIIMPALGMAQDTGLIVNWCKDAGDKVSASDILLEVETDKSVMEVEAGHDGYVAAILADASEAVPVGSVIAVISAEKPERPVRRSAKAAPQPQAAPAAKAEDAASDNSNAPSKPKGPARPVAPVEGRILASPKARRLAREQGLDLTRLAEEGVAQPYHVSDLETLRGLGARVGTSPAAAPANLPLHIEARVPASGFAALLDWLRKETTDAPSSSRIWLGFASAALRSADARERIVVGIDAPGSGVARFVDADRKRLGATLEETEDGEADIILRDLTGSAVIRATARAETAPVLTIGRDREDFLIGFDYHDSQLNEAAALAFVTGFAGRLEEPLRHLL